jgi:hypothetical protein
MGRAMELTVRPSKRGWTKPGKAAKYAGVSLKVFYGWLKDGLTHSKLSSGRILVQYDAVDIYLGKYEVTDGEIHLPEKVEQFTGAVRRKMRKGGK